MLSYVASFVEKIKLENSSDILKQNKSKVRNKSCFRFVFKNDKLANLSRACTRLILRQLYLLERENFISHFLLISACAITCC